MLARGWCSVVERIWALRKSSFLVKLIPAVHLASRCLVVSKRKSSDRRREPTHTLSETRTTTASTATTASNTETTSSTVAAVAESAAAAAASNDLRCVPLFRNKRTNERTDGWIDEGHGGEGGGGGGGGDDVISLSEILISFPDFICSR